MISNKWDLDQSQLSAAGQQQQMNYTETNREFRFACFLLSGKKNRQWGKNMGYVNNNSKNNGQRK